MTRKNNVGYFAIDSEQDRDYLRHENVKIAKHTFYKEDEKDGKTLWEQAALHLLGLPPSGHLQRGFPLPEHLDHAPSGSSQ